MKNLLCTAFLLVSIFYSLSGQEGLYTYDSTRLSLINNYPALSLTSSDVSSNNEIFEDAYWNKNFTVPGIVGIVGSSTTDGNNLYLGGLFKIAGNKQANNIVKWDGQNWSTIGEGSENGVFQKYDGDVPYVQALAYANGKLYVGGQFPKAGSLEVNGIAYWDGTEWHRMGSDSLTNGVSKKFIIDHDTIIGRGYVYQLFAYKNKLYVGGDFHMAGGMPSNGVAIWNMETEKWESMQGGLESIWDDDPVYAYAFAARENDIYIGGKFDYAGGLPAENIAKWDGKNWLNIGEAEAYVYDLEFDSAGILYATGFNYSDQITRDCGLAKYDGKQWEAIKGPEHYYSSITDVHIHNNTIYTSGYHYNAQTNAQFGLAKWDGDNWEFIPGLGQAYNEFLLGGTTTIESVNGRLYFAGDFTKAGETFPVDVVEWVDEESEWRILDGGLPHHGIHGGSIGAFAKYGNALYAGGFFSVAGGISARNIAKWNGSAWEALGHDYNNGVRGSINCILVDDKDVYVGGYFGSAGSVEAYHVAHWDGTNWNSIGRGVGGVPGASVNALAKVGDYLYVGGYFSVVGDDEVYAQPANSIARFNLNSKRWEAIGDGLKHSTGSPGKVNAIEIDGNKIYIGGQFYYADYQYYKNFAVLTDNKWSGIGMNNEIGIEGNIYTVRVVNDELYIGGVLLPNQSNSSLGIMKWGEKEWEAIGDSLTNDYGNVFVNDIEPFRDGFIAGGSFKYIGGETFNNIAYYDGKSWLNIKNGILAGVNDVEVFEDRIFFGTPEESYVDGHPSVGIAQLTLETTTADQHVFANSLSSISIQTYPNPFDSKTVIHYSIQHPGITQLVLFDQNGRMVKQLFSEYKQAGDYQYELSNETLPAGTYFCQLINNHSLGFAKLVKF